MVPLSYARVNGGRTANHPRGRLRRRVEADYPVGRLRPLGPPVV
jgi:hypothetical protein